MVTLEVCVDTHQGARAAVDGGAGRIELCSSLSEGGLTPSVGLMQAAAKLPVPCYAMIRPRSGLFHYTATEVQIMLADIQAACAAGLAGVVLGAQTAEGALDMAVLAQLCAAASGMGKTLHRVIDVVPDQFAALEQTIELGFERVLTSGAQPFATDGAQRIKEMVGVAGDRISIMRGCGLTPQNVREIVRVTGATEVHAACQVPAPEDPAFSDFDPPRGRWVTSQSEVQHMIAAMNTGA